LRGKKCAGAESTFAGSVDEVMDRSPKFVVVDGDFEGFACDLFDVFFLQEVVSRVFRVCFFIQGSCGLYDIALLFLFPENMRK
jgi:hypothetical protein